MSTETVDNVGTTSELLTIEVTKHLLESAKSHVMQAAEEQQMFVLWIDSILIIENMKFDRGLGYKKRGGFLQNKET